MVGLPSASGQQACLFTMISAACAAKMKLISHQLGAPSAEIDRTVQTVDQKLNEKVVAGGSGAQ
jgi:hypothetical protein